MTMRAFRSALLGASLGFAVIWVALADQHRIAGAFGVVGIGLLLTVFSVRTFGLLERARREESRRLVSHVEPQLDMEGGRPVSTGPELPERGRARFLGALGHELRNPLNSVTGFSDMLLGSVDGALNPEQERSVRTIRASAERLLRLVSTVVDQAKLEAGTLRLQQQWVAPNDLITEAIGFARSRAEATCIDGGVAEGLPRVFVDRHRTVQALVSLTVLVARSSDADVAIRVASPRRDQSGRGFVQFDVIASVSDTARGTLAVVEKLEKPLSRSDALGLEVAVARSVIEAQGGRIWTEAGTAGSLRVCMTLPTSAS